MAENSQMESVTPEKLTRGSRPGFRDLWNTLARLLSRPAIGWLVAALVILLCVIGNLPWHLDNYDQAKQAYVSHEILHGGSWWFQHTPRGDTATKPPLAGWISVLVRAVTGSWELAWRLPGFLCTVALLVLLIREGGRILPDGGGALAAAAFGLNLFTPRLATLVRTDMMLSLFIAICGWVIWRKLLAGTRWTLRDQGVFFAAMLGGLLTKGPIIYAFLLPGMVAFAFLAWRMRSLGGVKPSAIWPGWWPWLVPLAAFAAWGVIALVTQPDFYEDVVRKELFSRFDQSLKPDERQQPFWFYLPHFLHKFAPWSLLVAALPIASQNVRRRVLSDPATLWLVCWAVGGLVCMTFIPSKRVDRIFPVLPPFCLLLVAMVSACQCGARVRAWCGAALIGAILMTSGYFLTIVIMGCRDGSGAMVRFGREVQARAAGRELAVVQGRDEAMILYADGREYLHADRALRFWQDGIVDALLIPERRLPPGASLPSPALDSGPISKNRESRYLLFLRPD